MHGATRVALQSVSAHERHWSSQQSPALPRLLAGALCVCSRQRLAAKMHKATLSLVRAHKLFTLQ